MLLSRAYKDYTPYRRVFHVSSGLGWIHTLTVSSVPSSQNTQVAKILCCEIVGTDLSALGRDGSMVAPKFTLG